MATPRIVTATEAQAHWMRYSDEGGCNYTHEEYIKDLVHRGLSFLRDKGAFEESRAFERKEEGGTCTIGGTVGKLKEEVQFQLSFKMPRLVLHSMDLRALTGGTELYLHDVEAFGTVLKVDESKEKCIFQVTAVGLDDKGDETSLKLSLIHI